MVSAEKKDKKLVTDLLSASFDENLSVNYIVRQDDGRKERIRALMEYSFEVCSRFGKIWLSDDQKACALVLYPHQKKTDLQTIWLDLKLIFKAVGIGGIGKAMKRESLIKKKQPEEPMAYLWFIGVNPMYQHSGIGSKLLKEVIAEAEKGGLPVYLETSTVKNLPWYRQFDFRVYDELVLTYVLYFLKYEAVK